MIKCLPLILFLLSFCVLWLDCEKDTAPLLSRQPELSLTAEDVTCTEVWLRLTVNELSGQAGIRLLRNDSIVYDEPLTASDTLLYDSGLLPNAGYRYRALLTENGKELSQSPVVSVQTMDTTSHNFQWETFEFPSPYGSATLYDVAIVNENDIWVCGEIYADSTQPWLPYNAVHWDGKQWELKRIPFIGPCSAVDYPPIRAIWAFSEDNILITNGGAIAKYNGSSTYLDCGMNGLLDGAISKIFATDPSNVYAVGGVGTIVHYDGSSWQKLESPAGAGGTELPITDIWGVQDSETGEPIVLCTATEKFDVSDHKIFKIGPAQGVSEIKWPFADRRPYSVWFKTLNNLFICGDGVFRINPIRQYQLFTGLPTFFKERIRGNDINDIYTAGDFGLLAHYNGLTWWSQPNSANDIFRGLDVKGNLVVAVGQKGVNGIILKGIHKP